MELRTVGELKNVPPILEYLLNSFQDEHMPPSRNYIVGQLSARKL